jgi:hypothetical protein
MEVSGQFHAHIVLPPGKQPLVPVVSETGWPPELFWVMWRGDKSVDTDGNRTSAVQPVAVLTVQRNGGLYFVNMSHY